MTDNTQPESLRLADDIHRWNNPCAKAAAELRRQHARIAELEAQIGALSAAPADEDKVRSVIGPLLNEFGERQWQSGAKVPHKSIEDAFDTIVAAATSLAASPTPPAEQQAPRCSYCDGTGDVHGIDGEWRGICTECDAGTALRQQAPKAAPGEPSAFPMTGDEEESDLGQWQPGTAKPNMDGTYLREFDEGEATSEFHQGVWLRDGFFPSDLQDVRWRGRTAPQQEEQELCPTCVALARTVMLDQVSFDRKPDCYGIRQITDDEGVEEWEDIRTSPDVAREEANDMMATGRGEIYEVVPLWTTPQPAPAPLSDGISQKTWALIDELEKLRSANRDEEDWGTLNKRDDELRAALAAQGGKDA